MEGGDSKVWFQGEMRFYVMVYLHSLFSHKLYLPVIFLIYTLRRFLLQLSIIIVKKTSICVLLFKKLLSTEILKFDWYTYSHNSYTNFLNLYKNNYIIKLFFTTRSFLTIFIGLVPLSFLCFSRSIVALNSIVLFVY